MEFYRTFFSAVCSFLISILFLPVLSCAQTSGRTSSTDGLLHYQDEISADYLREKLSVISADSLKGRYTGSPGLKTAAHYLAKQYNTLDLKPVGDNSSYLQHFELSALKRDSSVFELYKKDTLITHSVESGDTTGQFIRAWGGSDSLSGDIVFAGFGVQDTVNGINNFGDMDLEGKWVLVFQQIPHVVEGDTLIDSAINGQTRFHTIIEEKGAAGMLILAPMSQQEFRTTAQRVQIAYSEPTRYGLAYLDNSSDGVPAGYNMIDPILAAHILGIDPSLQKLVEYRQTVLQHIKDFTPRTTDYTLTYRPYTSRITKPTQNVAALLEGSDPDLKDEVVVLSAHYDHLGVGRPDSTGDAIYNGADDDGSGTVALLNIAQALSKAKEEGHAPRRSILFLHMAGEELGLLGSRYYSDHPIIPMDKTVADINIDMIGRIDSTHRANEITDYAYIIGSEIISSELDSLLKVANARSGNIQLDKGYNDLQDPNKFYRRSDHWNFGRFRVPFIFFFTGVHEDYHRPSDEIEKIKFGKMTKIIKTIYATVVVVANEETPPKVDNEAFIEVTKSNPR